MLNHKRTLIAALVSVSLMGCGESTTQTETKPQLTAQDAKQFLTQAQNDIAKMQVPAAHAEWSYATNINFDTAAVSAYFNEVLSTKVAKLAKEAAKFNDVDVDADTRRQL
ncbi:MAG: M2 family metallopeptidase, partial [Pseudomonadota bacterium]|nr:M2 family metallopeptidase [Pseudomonadota bacterium]